MQYELDIHSDIINFKIQLPKGSGIYLSPDDAEILEGQLYSAASKTLIYLLNKHLFREDKIKFTLSNKEQECVNHVDKSLSLWDRYYTHFKSGIPFFTKDSKQQLRETDKFLVDGVKRIKS